MSAGARPPAAGLGKTRTCPHCKSTVLESASVCPGCRHHLRFDAGAAQKEVASCTAWQIDGTIGPRAAGEPCEYSVVIAIRNEQGKEIARQVVAVGALQPSERRGFTLSVEVMPARAQVSLPQPKPSIPPRSSPPAPYGNPRPTPPRRG